MGYPHCKGPKERAARRKLSKARYRARNKAKLAAYRRKWRASRPGYNTPYVRAHRARAKAAIERAAAGAVSLTTERDSLAVTPPTP